MPSELQVPAGWETSTIEELMLDGAVTYGVVQPGPAVESGTPMLRVNNFRGYGLDTSDVMRIAPDVEAKYTRTRIRADDVLITVVGSVGQVAVVPKELAGWNVARAVALLRPRERQFARWIASCLRAPTTQHALGMAANTTVQTTINLKDLRKLELPIPPAAERQAIQGVLSALDDRIDLLRQTNATLESIAQALFKSWFIDFDPVRAKAEGREPEGMDAATAALFPAEFEASIPAGWQMGTLETLCAQGGGLIQTGPFGSQLHASDYEAQGIPVVMPQDLDGRRISTDRVARVSVAHVERLARHKLLPGDIVFSRRGDVGQHAAVTEVEAGWLCGTGCLLVRPGPRWPSPAYVSQALATPEATDWVKRHAVGATMPNLNTGILGALPMLLPSNAVLAAFESVCGALEARITKNRAQALALSELLDTLLPRLISGKLRLPEARSHIEEVMA